MKKIAFTALGLILAMNLCACSCSVMDPAIEPTTTVPTTNNTILPTENMTVPVPETNIPDPEVNGNSTDPMNVTTGMGDTDNRTGPIN